LAEFDYTLRADGTDAALNETFWTAGGTLTNSYTWNYDNLDRLVAEALVSSDANRNFSAAYTYDLVGNRVQYTLTVPASAGLDETITSRYDANDRLLQEVSTLGSTTTYGYDHTQEISKIVTQSDGSSVSTTFTYDLQGNMKTASVDTRSSSGALLNREMLTYGYDANGIRVSALDQIDGNGDGTWDQQALTEYLNDPENFTGYSQVLRETHTDATTGQISKVVDYTFGLSGLAQTVRTYANGQVANTQTNVFGYDGHGSVRVLTDLSAAVAQIYVYDAYGNMLAIYSGTRGFMGNNGADAITSLLYSGEQFDPQMGMQYLRARYYDPSTGRFNQLDSFFGRLRDPQSFHKYTYVQDDPTTGVDPSGRCLGLVGLLVGFQMAINLRAQNSVSVLGVQWRITWLFKYVLLPGLVALWATLLEKYLTLPQMLFLDQTGSGSRVTATPEGITSALEGAIRNREPISLFSFTGHGDSTVVQLQDPWLMHVVQNRVLIENADDPNGPQTDITDLLNRALAPDAEILLQGCLTAAGADNIARRLSIALPGRMVRGDATVGLYVTYDTVLAPTRSYINGVEQ
jgi:RHS repeat-associated protein